MPKKQSKETKDSHDTIQTDALNKELFAENVLVTGNHILQSNNIIIPVSPTVDSIFNGGIREGSFCILTGPPKCGKTTTVLHFVGNAQQKQYQCDLCDDIRPVFYYDVEARLKKRDIAAIHKICSEKFFVIKSSPGNILCGERFLEIANNLINRYPGAIHIIDSFSALVTDAEFTKSMDEMQRADGPKLLAKFCRKVANVLPVNKSILIGITHMMGNPTGYGKATKEKSGFAVQYHVDFKLAAKQIQAWKDDDDQVIGQTVTWECESSSLGPPHRTGTSYLRYGSGIDEVYELITIAKDIGLIKLAGAWYTLTYLQNTPKYQGIKKVVEYLQNNPTAYQQLQQAVGERMNYASG